MIAFSYDCDYKCDIDRKQHVGFSQYAYTILKDDYALFNTDTRHVSWNSFLNRIIENYQDMKLYPTNISHQFNCIYNEYCNSFTTASKLTDKQLNTIKNNFRDSFINAYKTNLKLSYPDKLSKTFNLSRTVVDRLGSMEGSLEDIIFNRPGKYITAIFESYARKPFLEREEILLYEQMEKLKKAIKRNKCIRFLHTNGQSYTFLPYTLQPDKMGTYWYLAGITLVSENKRYYSSFRVSRLLQIREIFNEFNLMSNVEKQELEKMISEKGIQFIVGHSTKAIIRFTPNAHKKYTSQLHRRPQIASEISSDTYEFNATLEQLEYYFFSFGNDVEILEPQELRDIFKQKYEQAAKLYTK